MPLQSTMNHWGLSFFIGLALGVLILFYETTFLLYLVGLFFLTLCLWSIWSGILKVNVLWGQICWWHWLWLILFFSGLVFRVRDVKVAMGIPIDIWAIYRISLVALVGCILLWQLATKRQDWIRNLFHGLLAPLAGYAIAGILSSFWSGYPLWTFYKSSEYLVDLCLLAAILCSIKTTIEFKALFDWTWLILTLYAGWVWIGAAIWTEEAVRHDVGLIGIQIHGVFPAVTANSLGELGAIIGAVAFSRLLLREERQIFYFTVLLFSVATIIFAQSRSPLTGFLLSIPIMLFVAKRIGVFALICLIGSGVVLLTSGVETFLEFFNRGQREEEFASLSGRVDMWEVAWELIQKRPMFGYGAYAGSRFTGVTNTMASVTSSALNTWLEVITGLGLLGIFLILGSFLGTWIILIRLIRQFRQTEKYFLNYCLGVEILGVLTVISFRSMFSPQLIWHPFFPSIFCCTWICGIRQKLAKQKGYPISVK